MSSGHKTEKIRHKLCKSEVHMTTIKQDVAQGEASALLDLLIAQQRVSPIDDLDELSRLWPADDDPDVLLEHVLGERAERRRLEGERAG